LSSELQSSYRNELSGDALSVDEYSFIIEDVDEYSFIIEDVDDGGKFTSISSVVNSSDSSNLYEFCVSLNERWSTVRNCGVIN